MTIDLPDGFNWQHWVQRWDRMQERYLVRRAERFDVTVRVIRASQSTVSRVVDLGCGAGTLTAELLEAFPQSNVVAIDFDPTLLALAAKRLEGYGERVRLIATDLRDPSWLDCAAERVDTVVSAAALHWLTPDELETLYHQVASILQPGGIFLNADHVGSDIPSLQRVWEQHREKMRREEGDSTADTWDGFWDAYARALRLDIREIHQRVIGGWESAAEEGMPLAWHFDKLKAAGFQSVDCFWRCDCDAIYGGKRKRGQATFCPAAATDPQRR